MAACADGTGLGTTSGEVATLEVVSGKGQRARVGEQLPAEIIVAAKDGKGLPVPGVELDWSANGGTITGDAVTDEAGRGSAIWQLDTLAAPQTATVGTAGVEPVSVGASVDPGAPHRVRLVTVYSDSAVQLERGDSLQLDARLFDRYGNQIAGSTIEHAVEGVTFTWSSADTTRAVVDANGLVLGREVGAVQVDVRAASLSDSIPIAVLERVLSLSIDVPDHLRAIGDTLRLGTRIYDRYANLVQGGVVEWVALDSTIASVSGDGVVTAKSQGDARIVGRVPGDTDTVTVPVIQEAASFQVSPRNVVLEPGATVQLDVEAFDHNGHPLQIIHYLSQTTELATVNEAGMVEAHAGGIAHLEVSGGGARVGVLVVVDGPAPENALPVVSIAAGGWNGCGVDASGTAWCWGHGSWGQIGDGGFTDAYLATPVNGGPWKQVSVGFSLVCGVQDEGAYCWGNDRSGALGSGSTVADCDGGTAGGGCVGTPTPVSGDHAFTAVSAGGAMDRMDAQSIASLHACGLTPEGSGWCWGDAYYGQLGHGEQFPADNPAPVAVAGALVFAEISAGLHHTCALTRDGEAYCWGTNMRGELGLGTTADTLVATPAAVATTLRFTQISAGDMHTCAVGVDGDVYCWGSNQIGQLGIGSGIPGCGPQLGCIGVPVRVELEAAAVKVTSSEGHTCALTSDGEIWCWGLGWAIGAGEVDLPMCGYFHNASDVPCSAEPLRVFATAAFTDVAAGWRHTCAIQEGSGHAYCWGNNSYYALGNGTGIPTMVPTRVLK